MLTLLQRFTKESYMCKRGNCTNINCEAMNQLLRVRDWRTAEVPLPAYVIEHMDEDVKKVLYNIHERASLRRTTMVDARDKANAPKGNVEMKPSKPSEDKPAMDEVSPGTYYHHWNFH